MAHIISVRVENILRAKQVSFSPKGQTVTIGGKNEQGKSSAITALAMALGGKSYVPPDPVHHGEGKGVVVVELEKYIVTLEITRERKTKLRVEGHNGGQFSSPQKMLTDLFGDLSFDPGSFINASKDSQIKRLMDLTGLDLSEFERVEKELFDERRHLGRKLDESMAALKAFPEIDETVPEEELSAQELINEISELQKVSSIRTKIDARRKGIKDRLLQIATELEQLETEDADLVQRLAQLPSAHGLGEMLERQTTTLSELDAVNKKIRAKIQWNQAKAALDAITAKFDAKENELKEARELRNEAVAAAKFPIPGLCFDANGITFDGVLFEQLSQSRKWDIATAIAFALNPKGIVFMSDCGGLDSDSRERVRERAAEFGVQLFLEVVDDAPDVQILIEEGLVKEDRLSGRQENQADS